MNPGTDTARRNSLAIDQVRGTALRLAGDDIDTDQIIASRFLTWISFEGLEAHVFEDARQAAAAAGATHPMDDPARRNAAILLVDRNFGCGSSREHAPQGLRRRGIRAILGQSFGEIFAGNCAALGIVCARLEPEAAAALAAAVDGDPRLALTLDVEAGTVRAGDATVAADMPEGRRRQFLDGGWDALAQLLEAAPLVAALSATLPPIRNPRAG